MARARKPGMNSKESWQGSTSKRESGARRPVKREKQRSQFTSGFSSTVRFAVVTAGLLVVVACGLQLRNYLHWSKLYTPFKGMSVVQSLRNRSEDLDRLWGSYRPHLYFGLRTRTPESLLFGLMWFAQNPKDSQLHLRYTCEQGDSLAQYGWLYHDGRHFGSQEIVDDDFILRTEFVKRQGGEHGGEWTARVSGRARTSTSRQLVSVMFLVANEGNERLTRIVDGGRIVEIRGTTKTLGSFKIVFPLSSKNVVKTTYLSTFDKDIHRPKDIISRNLQYHLTGRNAVEEARVIGLAGDVKDEDGNPPNFHVVQVTFKLPFDCDVVFISGSIKERRDMLAGHVFDDYLKHYKAMFDDKFERIFKLKEKGYEEDEIAFAKASLSNMIGGIGYFYGASQVKSSWFDQPVKYWDGALYTGVPSRSFFPRGFLWDEGFHQLLISRWDTRLTFDVIAHWMDMMNAEGWIPREQILGPEARQKVPDEFVTQHNKNANPPTFFLTLDAVISDELARFGEVTTETQYFLRSVYPRLRLWFHWYNSSQTGTLPSSYRWRGRDAKTDRELNPKTLTSGLDDYPRASHPSADERHVDLRCWIGVIAGILYKIGGVIEQADESYRQTHELLSDNDLLNQMHWCAKQNIYCDYGNHTRYVALERRFREPGGATYMARVIRSKQGPTLKFVPAHGYVSLFPFLLQIIDPHSSKLKVILEDLRNPDLLWTPYGLRSLAKTDALYMKYNTEHDPPYWRGPIWINMNYLAIRALRHYADSESPYRDMAKKIYQQLRANVINNIYSQYKRSGYIWEQYNDKTGKGQGTYPFTGWSGLVTLIMGEIF